MAEPAPKTSAEELSDEAFIILAEELFLSLDECEEPDEESKPPGHRLGL